MFEFKYQINLTENGRPYIDIPDEYNHNPEDKFMAVEITKYLLSQVYDNRKSEGTNLDIESLETTLGTLEIISDQMAMIIKEQMESMEELDYILQKRYHILVKDIEDRNKLNYEGIIYNGKIYKREPGLKVLVANEMKIYELRGGRDNDNWKEIN